MDGRIFCEKDYLLSGYSSTRQCKTCSGVITGPSVRLHDSHHHPACFTCSICHTRLDKECTMTPQKKVLCVKDYIKLYSPKCGKCGEIINPMENTRIVVRVQTSNQDFHLDCFSCEICGQQLGGEEGPACYPLSGLFMCKKCHVSCLNNEDTKKKKTVSN